MKLINMEKILPEVKEVVEGFVNEFGNAYSSEIVSINIYGSLARGDYRKGISDINTAFVVEDTGFSSLKQVIKVVAKYRKKRVTVPLIFTPEYIYKSLDSFPLEFLELKENHIVIYGEDIFAQLEIESSNLRLQVEQILKGRLLRIRQWYLENGLSRKGLKKVLEFGLKDVFPGLRNLIRLKKGYVPSDREETVKELEDILGINLNFINQIWERKYLEPQEWYLQNFLSLLVRASEVVDEI